MTHTPNTRISNLLTELADAIPGDGIVEINLTVHPAPPTQRYLSTKQAAEYLGFTVKAIEEMVAKKRIPFAKTGPSKQARNRFDRHELDEWMREHHSPVGGVRP